MERNVLSIRLARAGDEVGIAVAHVQSWQETYSGLLPQSFLDSLSVDKRREMWQGVIARNAQPGARAVLLVAQDPSGAIVGFVSAGPDRTGDSPARGELYAIYLLKGAQGRGAGRALLEEIAHALLSRGFESMRLWVLENNPTRRFYEKLGGRLQSETKKVEIGGVEVLEVAYQFDIGGKGGDPRTIR